MHRFLFLKLLLCQIPRMADTPAPAATPSATPPAATPSAATPPATPPAPNSPFYESFTDETDRAFVQTKGYNDINQLAKSAREANRYIDSTHAEIRYPRDDAPEDVRKDFYKRIGVPETPDAYQFTHPEGVTVDPKFETFGKTLAHELGLTPKQAQTMAEKWGGFTAEYAREVGGQTEQQAAEAVTALKSAWGDKFDTNLADGQKAFKALGLPADKVSQIEAAMGTAPLMELMATLGKKMGGEGNFVPSGAGGNRDPAQMSPAEAKVELDKLSVDTEFQKALWDKNHPQHKAAVEKNMVLTGAAHRA